MAMLYVLYRTPADARAFDRYYFDVHVPIAKRIPGLRGYTVTRGSIKGPDGTSPYQLIATLAFDSVAAIEAALASPEGQAAVADLANFATGGVEVRYAETETIS